MRKTIFSVAILAFPGFLFSTPAIAGCIEDLYVLRVAIPTEATAVSDAVLQQGLVVMDDAKALCEVGDEAGAAKKIYEAKAILGLPA